jgi:AraC-like DNA-binding protein
MGLAFEHRPSDSPYIERVWHSRSHDVDRMMSVARAHWDLVFWETEGQVRVGVQGPESRASTAPVPHESVSFGVRFSLGTRMPHLPIRRLVDGFTEMPGADRRSFRLMGASWPRPDFGNAEEFVRRLVRDEVVVRDPLVPEVLARGTAGLCERTVQRRFIAATGLTRGAVRQIERAQRAAVLIQEGSPPIDVVHLLGYFDQPHLARSLTRFMGRTATQLRAADPAEPLSLLYKT